MAFTSVQKIRFDDVDGAGIVYYPQFFHMCHAAFEDFFDTVTPISYPEMIRDKRLGFPTVHIDSDFRAPMVYGDTAIVSLEISKIGNSSVCFCYQIRRKRDAVHCFSASITTVLIDLDSQESRSLPDELRGIFTQFLAPEYRG